MLTTDNLKTTKYDFSNIMHKLRTYGVVIIPDFLSLEETRTLETSLSLFRDKNILPGQVHYFDGPARYKIVEEQYSPGAVFRITPPSYQQFSSLCDLLFRNRLLNGIVDDFYGTPNNKFMQIFAYHDTQAKDNSWNPGKTDNSALHFDPYQAIKFAFYLTDTSEENGMTRFIPSSHEEGKYFRENHLKPTIWRGQEILDCHTLFRDSEFSEQDALCPSIKAGSMVIFNTDAWHAGGEIKKAGLERKCVIVHNRRV